MRLSQSEVTEVASTKGFDPPGARAGTENRAGRTGGLLARTQVRDLFDCRQIFSTVKLDPKMLRIGFVVYGGMNRKDWRTVLIDDIGFQSDDLANRLIPTLRRSVVSDGVPAEKYGQALLDHCRDNLSAVLPLKITETEFLNVLLEEGHNDATPLTDDVELRNKTESHPLLRWRALNVWRYKGFEQSHGESTK